MTIHDMYQKSFETICSICTKPKILYEPCTSFYKNYYYVTVVLFTLSMGYYGLIYFDSQAFKDYISKSVEPKPIEIKTKNHIIKKRRLNYVNLPIKQEPGLVPDDQSSGLGSDIGGDTIDISGDTIDINDMIDLDHVLESISN